MELGYWTCPNASSQQTGPRKNENNSTSPDRENFSRLDAQPCSVLNVMPKVKERAWHTRQFREKIKRQNQSKCQEPKDRSSKNEYNSTSPDRGNFSRLYWQHCSVLNVMPKVKERAWRARQFSEIKILFTIDLMVFQKQCDLTKMMWQYNSYLALLVDPSRRWCTSAQIWTEYVNILYN